MKQSLFYVSMGVIAGALTACDEQAFLKSKRQIEALSSPAKGVVSSLSSDDDVGIVQDQPDYGIKVSFSVKNTGEAGTIKIMPWLSCSEGEWTRTQNLPFVKDEIEQLTFFFHEPTINATNIRCGVKVLP